MDVHRGAAPAGAANLNDVRVSAGSH
jgi:hypothetical protein